MQGSFTELHRTWVWLTRAVQIRKSPDSRPRRWWNNRANGDDQSRLEVRIRTDMPSPGRAWGRGLWPPGSLLGASGQLREANWTLLPAPELSERDRENPPARLRQNVITVVEEDPALEVVVAAQRSQPRHAATRRPPRRTRHLHSDSPGARTIRHDQIHLLSVPVTKVPEPDVGIGPRCLRYQLVDNEGFEEVAHPIPLAQPVSRLEPVESSGEPAVHNVHLRRPHESPVDVAVPGQEAPDEEEPL